ncbi:M20/M25/M40 family metallo-hydrolase [Candidatus Peregrinibacteria bacterium]|nr:MAG: M20/M25/M40 family metallo-hydrolase [Candidatus Peregrinibacteria bacterium]
MLKDILSLSEKFISIPSDPENKKALSEILDFSLSQVSEFTIEKFEKNGVRSALIFNTEKRPSRFQILLNSHLDVIPGKPHQYIPKIKENRLYGVGAMDMKANLACALLVFKKIAKSLHYPIALQLVTDEEVGGYNGTKYQIQEHGVRSDFVITTEPTNLNIVHKAKGVLWIKISCTGKAAHGAYPWRGENALWKMQNFLNILQKKYPIPHEETWQTTVNLSRIETQNKSFNKIPDNCEAWLDIRCIPEESQTIIYNIQSLLPEGFFSEILFHENALLTEKRNLYLQNLQKIAQEITQKEIILYGAHGTSDARHFFDAGCNGIEFGPIGEGIGTDNEWVDIPSLEKYSHILEAFLLSYNTKD